MTHPDRQSIESSRFARLAMCCTVFFGFLLTRWLTGRYAFPLYAEGLEGFPGESMWLENVSVGFGALALVALALLSNGRSGILRGETIPLLSVGCILVGAVLTAIARQGASVLAFFLAAPLVDVGCTLVGVVACMGALGLPAADAALCVAAATAAAYAVRGPLMGLEPLSGYVVFVAVALGTAAFTLAFGSRALERAMGSDTPRELAVTNPLSFLPMGHRLFVSIFAFEVAYGFAITVGDYNEGSSWSVAVAAAFALLAVAAGCSGASKSPDRLLIVCIVAMLAGILALPIGDQTVAELGRVSFSLGSGMFKVLALYTLVSIGSRNEAGSLSAIAWGSAVLSIGDILGVNLGLFAAGLFDDVATAPIATYAAAIVFVASMLAVLDGFSIKGTIESVRDVVVPVASSKSDDPDGDGAFQTALASVASAGGLTARETEVLALLAKGRNSPFIQEALGVSYNTTRTHVRHIYEKCGFHNQQELIDAVEDARRGR